MSYSFQAQENQGFGWIFQTLPSHGLYERTGSDYFVYDISTDRKSFTLSGRTASPPTEELGTVAAHVLRQRIYRFLPERYGVSSCRFGRSKILAPNGANLPEVLNLLQANRPMFQDYNALVHRIFPSIYEVSIRPSELNADSLEILVRTDERDSRRMDLAIPLNECGTGVGQVLAMLYVAMTAQYPQVIIIDEPSSFLHPAAARKLIDCLRVYPQHQYIISTHSPEILRAADPQTVIFIRWERPASVVEVLNTNNLAVSSSKCNG